MALSKVFVKPNGITTEYHRISQADLSVRDDNPAANLFVTVTSYLNEEYREAGHSIESLHYHFTLEQGEDENIGVRELAYNKIKTLSEWADATDC